MSELTVACFAYRSSRLCISNLPDPEGLVRELVQRDIQVVLSGDAESAFDTTTGEVKGSAVDAQGQAFGRQRTISSDSLGVIVNCVNRSFDMAQMPSALPPVINKNTTRSLAYRKHRVDQEVLRPILQGGMRIPTWFIETAADLDAMRSESTSSRFFFKPTNGSNSRGTQDVGRSSIDQTFLTNPELYGNVIAQPTLDFTIPFPSSIRAFSDRHKEGFIGWSSSAREKELRVYGFHSPAGVDVFPVARAITRDQSGERVDNWFFVDPQTIPEQVLDGTRSVIGRAAEVSGATALYGTVDFGYCQAEGVGPGWRAIELNARFPYLIGYDKDKEVGRTLRSRFADQISATARHEMSS